MSLKRRFFLISFIFCYFIIPVSYLLYLVISRFNVLLCCFWLFSCRQEEKQKDCQITPLFIPLCLAWLSEIKRPEVSGENFPVTIERNIIPIEVFLLSGGTSDYAVLSAD